MIEIYADQQHYAAAATDAHALVRRRIYGVVDNDSAFSKHGHGSVQSRP